MRAPQDLVNAKLIAGLICFLLPIVLVIVWKVRTKAKITSALIGAGGFLVFVLILEAIFNNLLFVKLPTGKFLTSNMWIYAIVGGFNAGLFEETARLLGMKFLMKNNLDKKNAIMHGIGHGGFEAAIYVGLLTLISQALTLITLNSGAMDSMIDADGTLRAQIVALIASPANIAYIAVWERCSSIILHISLSYIVYRAVKNKKYILYVLAILIHTVTDALTVVLSQSGASYTVIEIVLTILCLAVLAVVIISYRREKDDESVLPDETVAETITE